MKRYQDIPTSVRTSVIEAMLEDDNSWGDVAACFGYRTGARARQDYAQLKRQQSAALKGMPTHAADFDARCWRMHSLRGEGRKWKDVAAELGYSSTQAAQQAYQKWSDRRLGVVRAKSRLSSSPEDVKIRRQLMVFMRDAGYSWDVIARTLGYSRGSAAAAAFGS